jgi:hypothetical protein
MKLQFGPITFGVVFSIAYAAVFVLNMPLFMYFPQVGLFNWGNGVVPNAGPGMAWYGLMATSALIALPLSFLVPDRFLDKILHNYVWVVPVVAMLVCLYQLKNWFLVT